MKFIVPDRLSRPAFPGWLSFLPSGIALDVEYAQQVHRLEVKSYWTGFMRPVTVQVIVRKDKP